MTSLEEEVDCFEKYVSYSEEKLELTVYGHLRDTEHIFNRIVIPKEIKHLIHEFCQFFFKWNHDLSDGGYLFFDDCPLKLQYRNSYKWGLLPLKNYILSSNEGNAFEWEIRIDQQKFNGYVFSFGFVSFPINQSIQRWSRHLRDDPNTRHQQFGVYIYSHNKFIKLFNINGGLEEIKPLKPVNMQIGSTFKLIFNFMDKTCSLYHNHEYIGIICKDIPKQLIPSISCYYPMLITCTKFAPLYSK